uniref:Reverse transcriptase domain-containing protein n=1 Tax=Tanacetum cinerariifolium TaxID=118510 RepID=A0A6L2MH65_TANCI|nr:hypothetical protein [Tanacetum cinerariifolium]
MILESVEHGPLIWPKIEENRVTRTKKYAELSVAEKIQADCDLKATNIILKGLPSDIYSLFNHHIVSKDLWEIIQLLMQDLHTTKFDQLQAYLQQHELYANEVRLMREHNQDPLALVTNHQMTPSTLIVPVFKQGDDPIDAIKKMMSFMSTVIISRFPTTNNQLRNSSNPRQQGTIHDGREQEGIIQVNKDLGVANGPVTENAAYQVVDLDAYDSNCNDFSTAKAVLMANLSSYISDVLSVNSPEFQDTANSGPKKETKAMVFYQMDTEEVSDRFVDPCFVNRTEAYDGDINFGVEENMISNEYAVKLCLEHEVKKGNKVVKKELIIALRGEIYFVKFIIYPEDDVEPGVIYDRSFLRMTKEITDFEEERPIIETMAYHDKYKKIIDEIWKDKVELDGKIVKEKEDAVKRIKGEALQEKDDLGAFIFPIRLEGQVNENALADTGSDINTMPYQIYETLGREDMKKVDRGITMINHTQTEAMGILINVLCRVGVTTLIAKFLILDILIDRDSLIIVGRGFMRTIGGIVNTSEKLFSTFDGFCHQTFCDARSDVVINAKSDIDDEEDYQIKRNKFGAPMYGPKPTPYLNCNDPAGRSLAIESVTNPFWKISVWKKAVSFLGSLPAPLKNVNWKPDYKGSLWEHTMMRPDHQDPNTLDNMKPWKRYCFHKFTMSSCYGKDVAEIIRCDGEIDDMLRIRLHEAGSDKEIFTFVAWIRAFNINESVYAELCYEFYSTYEFDEVCADDELQTKKIIKLRLGGLHSDEHFNAQDYWLNISHEENLGLPRIYTSTIRNLILRVIHKMITYSLYQRTTGYDKIQKNDLWLLKDVVRSLSAPIYCRDLDTITLRDLINSGGKLIIEDPQLGIPRVGIPIPQRESI